MMDGDGHMARPVLIDGLQYCNWSEKIFHQLREGSVDAIHVTICYHENFRETIDRLVEWKQRFAAFPTFIMPGRTVGDIDRARASGRTAVFFGSQNPSAIEDNLGLVEILHELGLRFMQLSYNNQSLLASGHAESEDRGITRMGREVIREMNRVGVVIDMSHSGERSTLEAIELSEQPIAITHANPASWHLVPRNKSDRVLDALAQSGGMLGLSLYPHHMKDGTRCSLAAFCAMVARLVERIGVAHVGIGSDLCQDQPDSVVEWMRNGRWMKPNGQRIQFPPQPDWFEDNRDFVNLRCGLAEAGFSTEDVDRILGRNWYDFFARAFPDASTSDAAASRHVGRGARGHAAAAQAGR
jgi:membrane dipeptidase